LCHRIVARKRALAVETEVRVASTPSSGAENGTGMGVRFINLCEVGRHCSCGPHSLF
jgi:hypothetical protein